MKRIIVPRLWLWYTGGVILLVTSKLSSEDLAKVAEDFDGYVKVVVDIERKILTAGGKLHSEGEELLLQDGSKQERLWGGGLDLETGEIDFDSMINIRPQHDNSSREVLLPDIRKIMGEVIRNLLQ